MFSRQKWREKKGKQNLSDNNQRINIIENRIGARKQWTTEIRQTVRVKIDFASSEVDFQCRRRPHLVAATVNEIGSEFRSSLTTRICSALSLSLYSCHCCCLFFFFCNCLNFPLWNIKSFSLTFPFVPLQGASLSTIKSICWSKLVVASELN